MNGEEGSDCTVGSQEPEVQHRYLQIFEFLSFGYFFGIYQI